MKKELSDSLRHMQANTTIGTPHNKQVISTQVETIFAIDNLTSEIQKLSKIIDDSNKQSEKLEKSNYVLQMVMLALTAIATLIAAYPVVSNIVKYLISLITTNDFEIISSIIATLISATVGIIISFVIQKNSTKLISSNLKETKEMLNRLKKASQN